jgi:predicted XRE-type DNA-binding protein
VTEKLEIIKGSGNIFRDLDEKDADVKQTKALLAAEIIRILDKEKLSVRAAGKVTGYNYSDFSRIRNAELSRFTIDKLMIITNALSRRVNVKISVTKKRGASLKSSKLSERAVS